MDSLENINVVLLQPLFSGIMGFLLIYISIPILIKVAYLKDLYDKPDNERKVHRNYIPTLGGVGIFIAFFLAFSLSGYAEQFTAYPYLAGGLMALFFCGLKDDLIGLSPAKKLSVEILAILLLIYGSGTVIDNLYGVFGVYEIPYAAGVLLTVFTMIVVINAYNLIDGIDGLAAGIGGIASVFFGVGFWVGNEMALAVMCLLLTVVLCAYLLHNFHPANIFMGDTGSLVIGFLLAVMTVFFVQLNEAPGFVAYFGEASPILPVAFLALPLYDTLRVFVRRMLRGASPFTPDSDHIHHVLMKLGWGQRKAVVYLYMASILIICIGIVSSQLGVNIALTAIIASTLVFFPTFGFKRKLFKAIGLDLSALFHSEEEMELYAHLNSPKRKAEEQAEEV
ncbi:MAG: undecaprenyl/decaprenyl-phosphate alpha-N-acetylglucosaminyl 1-phosphate transferase [Balneolaceae bacterium]|nr:undecaprenyl/decaprenyl-phosphate alpha-N-acetylglucosaminyl 1-phosphate transferase [Balneolaceae bacterium]